MYVLVGCSLVGYAYDELMVNGGINRLDANLFHCIIGFLSLSFGIAAILGAAMNLAFRKFQVSVEPQPKNRIALRSKMSFGKACGLKPDQAVSIRPYVPSQVAIGNSRPKGPFNPIADKLVAIGFSKPVSLTTRLSNDTISGSTQLGCQDMVVFEMEDCEGGITSRMISMLEDGLTLITLSFGRQDVAEKRLGTSGYYGVSDNGDPESMLAFHLEQTISMAEIRGTGLVTFDASELGDISEFANRVFADIQTQYGEAYFRIGTARHGRFHFPPRPVTPLRSLAS